MIRSQVWASRVPRSNSAMALSRSSPPSSSCSTTRCSSLKAPSKPCDSETSGFGLNGINRSRQSTVMQLNSEALARAGLGGGVEDVACVVFDDGVAARQRGGRAEGAYAAQQVLDGAAALAE